MPPLKVPADGAPPVDPIVLAGVALNFGKIWDGEEIFGGLIKLSVPGQFARVFFLLSSLLGVPLGILCGALPAMGRLTEPFIEFFRYLPAPAFGALAVAVLGINDAPKVAIIFIGTFFQQVLIIANTTRRIDPALLEAAQTLGASPRHLLMRVVVPGIITDVYTDMRVLLGWAWTYLIVAELIGVSSGITFFINQQAKYRAYDRVFAAIIVIGLVGRDLHPLSHLVQAMRKTRQTSEFIAKMGPFFVGYAQYRV